MSEGIVIFAHNNEQHDYFKQAVFAADQASYWLKRPVTIITDEKSINNRTTKHNIILTEPENKGTRNMAAKGEDIAKAHWHNANRNTVYDLTPYEKTLVIDSDYILFSNILEIYFDDTNSQDFLCFRNVFDITNRRSFDSCKYIGQYQIPHFWATAIFFKKSKYAKLMFEAIAMVKKYYTFYRDLYKFDGSLYRNDFAVSIALLMLNGHNVQEIKSMRISLFTMLNDVKITKMIDNGITFTYKDNGKEYSSLITGTDVHVLNKFELEKMIDARS